MQRQTDMRRWQDWVSFALGLWLAVSPWLAGYAGHDAATANAAVAGLALALAAHFGFSIDHLSTEWLTLGIGLWLLVAPFALGFEAHHAAAINAVAVGALIAALSASALKLDRDIGRLLSRLIAGH
jgi:hypothetical protein